LPKFGFSAFLKLLSLNSRPQRTLIRKRLSRSGSSGYDFHRSLRLLAGRYVNGSSLEDVLALTEDISRPPEKQSAQSGLRQLAAWRLANPGSILSFESVLFESPAKNFKVQFQPDFGIQLGEQKVAAHIWNTRTVELDRQMMYAALSVIAPLYSTNEDRPDDVGVLSLPDQTLYRLSEVGDYTEVGSRLVRRLDDIFEEILREPQKPGAPPKGRPIAPPPAR
jgi:hypothetical protein